MVGNLAGRPVRKMDKELKDLKKYEHDLRRVLRTASSVGNIVGIGTWDVDNAKVDVEYGNNLLVSDVQNVYVEENLDENEENANMSYDDLMATNKT